MKPKAFSERIRTVRETTMLVLLETPQSRFKSPVTRNLIKKLSSKPTEATVGQLLTLSR